MSMVEVLVALVAGLMLMGAMIQVLSATRQTNRLVEARGRMQENARFVFELLTRSVREAGYKGCGTSGSLTNTLSNGATSYLYNFALGLQGAEWTAGNATTTVAANWTPARDASITNPLPNNDIITVRGALAPGFPLSAAMTAATGDVTIAANSGFSQCDIVMVSDCSSASVMQITSATPNTSGTLSHAAPGGCVAPQNATTALAAAYGRDAEVAAYATTSYYIAAGASGEPALFRQVGSGAAEELVEGIERMQIRYGEDTEALPTTPQGQPDFTPNRYVTANNVGSGQTLNTHYRQSPWERVVSVRISLVVRSSEDRLTSDPVSYPFEGTTITPTDRRLRHVFTTTIGLRNSLLN